MKGLSIHIVGAGIVGLCAAWYLNQEGCEVIIVDKSDGSNGTSFGNAGMIVPSHFIPMAAPGVIAQGIKWLLNSKSPFYIKPRLNADLLQWLWHFYRSSNHQHVANSMHLLYNLNERSKWLYKEMGTVHGLDFGFEERGLLMLYRTKKQAIEEEKLANQAHRLGVETAMLDSKGLQALEPEMDFDVLGGVYFPGDAHLYPNQLMLQLRTRLKENGVSFVANTEVVDFKMSGSKVDALLTSKNQIMPVSNVLLSSGSWSGLLLKKIGVKIHLQAGKGYSITLKEPQLRPRIPTILSEAKVAITPMGDDLRIGGTLELSGLSEDINHKRVQGVIESVSRYYKNIDVPCPNETEIWKGYRPCAPDGMPYVGQLDDFSNLFVGTGHGMMGLSLGAVTGKMLCEMITDQQPSVEMQPFRLNRFN